jgi:hypothetical protein
MANEDQCSQNCGKVRYLKSEIIKLKGRAIEDQHFAEQRHILDVGHSRNADTAELEKQIVELKKTIEQEGAIIDRIVVYLTGRDADHG